MTRRAHGEKKTGHGVPSADTCPPPAGTWWRVYALEAGMVAGQPPTLIRRFFTA